MALHRCNKYSDYIPSPLNYQYRYFYPTPVLPSSKTGTMPRVHTCAVHSHEHGCNLWSTRKSSAHILRPDITRVRDNAIKKMLPWRPSPKLPDVLNDTSFYTGKGITYKSLSSTDLLEDAPTSQKFPDLVKSSHICAAHASRSYTLPGIRISPEEWRVNNHQLTSSADYVHNACAMIKTEAQDCINDAEKEQTRRSSDTSKDLDSRLNDIDAWISNEKDELRFNINQTHELLELKERLESMLKSIESPLEISQENILARESRRGAEHVNDAVSESLLKEAEILKKSQDRLLAEMDRMNKQLTKLRASRHEIELDVRNKEDARRTDECVRMLNQLSNEIGKVDLGQNNYTTSSPATWALNTQNLIQRSQEERNTAQVLYTEVSRAMISSADECFNAWYTTNASFNTRITEMITAKQQLEHQLLRINQDIDSLNRHLANVRKAIDDKMPLLKLAQARLEKRKQRPGIELCRDKVMLALYKEIHSLKQATELLQGKLQELEETMGHLMRTQSALETDIKNKELAIFIDRERCLSLRQSYPISNFKETRMPKKIGSNGMPESRSLR